MPKACLLLAASLLPSLTSRSLTRACCAAPTAGAGVVEITWVDTDWSAGAYVTDHTDPAASPGELVLTSDPADMTVYLEAERGGLHPENQDAIFTLAPFSREPWRLYYGPSGALDGSDSEDHAQLRYYDLTTDTETNVFDNVSDPPENAILRIHELDGRLYTISNDCHGPQNLNFYSYDPDDPAPTNHGWRAHIGVIPLAYHIGGLAKCRGDLYAAGGPVGSGPAGQSWWAEERVFRSTDGGASWSLLTTLGDSHDPAGVCRGAVTYQDQLVLKAACYNRVDVYDARTGDWRTMRLPDASTTTETRYAEFDIWQGRLWMMFEDEVFMLDGLDGEWRAMPSPEVYIWGPGGHNGMRGIGDYLYVAGMKRPPDPPPYLPIATPQLKRMHIDDLLGQPQPDDWEMVNAQVAPDEDYLRLHDIRFFHGRVMIADERDGRGPRIHAARCADTGYLLSAVHDFGVPAAAGTIAWDMIRPPGTQVKLQLRSAIDPLQLAARAFTGPAGRPGGYYTSSPSPIWSGHAGDNLFQYRVVLAAADGGRLAPILDDVRLTIDVGDPSGTETATPAVLALRLEQNVPNPFNPRTRIGFTLPVAGRVRLSIYDVAGRLVRTLVDGPLGAGAHVADWDGRGRDGRALAAGAFLCRLQWGGATRSRIMLLVK